MQVKLTSRKARLASILFWGQPTTYTDTVDGKKVVIDTYLNGRKTDGDDHSA